jgi:hypothetical protein
LFVHFVGLGFHFGDLLLSGGDVLFEFLDFVVEDVLELFEFLGFFFKIIDFSLIGIDGFVSVLNN